MPDPQKPTDGDPEEEKVETKETEDGGVEVPLDDEPILGDPEPEEPEPEEKEPEGKPDPEKLVIDKKTHDRLFAQSRLLKTAQAQLAEANRRLVELQQTPPSEKSKSEESFAEQAQKDAEAAVRKAAREEAEALLAAQQKQIAERARIEEARQIQETNAHAVLAKHPELEDPASEKAQVWQSIMAANPRFATLPDGPTLVMYKMEEELRSRGLDVPDPAKEAQRRQTASAASLKPSRPTSPAKGKVVLSREQREFCDEHGISYTDYAKTLRQQETGVIL